MKKSMKKSAKKHTSFGAVRSKVAQALGVPGAKPAENKAKKNGTPAPTPPGPGEIAVSVGPTDAPRKVNVPATIICDYFALHQPLTVEGTLPTKKTSRVALTHAPTGMAIGRYRTRALAAWVAMQLFALGDPQLWNFTDPDHLRKHGDAKLLERARALSNEYTAEDEMKRATPKPAGRVPVEKIRGSIPRPPTASTQAWRSGVDWVAAGKKAYETRLKNLAAKQAAAAPPPPPIAPKRTRKAAHA